IPTDAVTGGDPDTNQSRGKPFDYILPSFNLATNQVATVIGAYAFSNGLVFDTRVYLRDYPPASDVAPATSGDSAASMMQHMAVVKDFRLGMTVTNFVTVSRPVVKLISTNILRWQGVSTLTYSVQGATDLT